MPPLKGARTEGTVTTVEGEEGGGDSGTLPDLSGTDDVDFGSVSVHCPFSALFLLSGPRGGVINARSGVAEMETLVDVVEDSVYHVLSDAWRVVDVPVDGYWQSPRALHDKAAQELVGYATRKPCSSALQQRLPDPNDLMRSFYSTRAEALAARGYAANRGLVVVAIDRPSGSGSKQFNVISLFGGPLELHSGTSGAPAPRVIYRSAIADFVQAIPRPPQRNLYVLVDEGAVVDPFFDIDFSLDATHPEGVSVAWLYGHTGQEYISRSSVLSAVEVEARLHDVLVTLMECVEHTWKSSVEECLVLTSSAQKYRKSASDDRPCVPQGLKISFHIHFRLRHRHAFSNIKELHDAMQQLREHLNGVVAGNVVNETLSEEAVRRAEVTRRLVDFGVYTRWRAFRLPYSVKAPPPASLTTASIADDLLLSQLASLDLPVPDIRVGSVAAGVLHNIAYAYDAKAYEAQVSLLGTMESWYKHLLPIIPGATQINHQGLKALLTSFIPSDVLTAAAALSRLDHETPRAVVASWAMELACIQRDTSTVLPSLVSTTGNNSCSEDRATFHRLCADTIARAPNDTSSGATKDDPFKIGLPPMPHCIRSRVDAMAIKQLLAEVFWCISPEYAVGHTRPGLWLEETSTGGGYGSSNAITPERITAQYEESIRAYYVFQKQNKYCIRQGRYHRSTYAQLYLTFGSIKIRCYANDCYDRCSFIQWEAPRGAVVSGTVSAHDGYPNYSRLSAIRNILFPQLPLSELVKRYGTQVVH